MKTHRALLPFFVLGFSLSLFSANAYWQKKTTLTPSAPLPGDVVTIEASFTVTGGTLTNLRIEAGIASAVPGTIASTIFYDRTFASVPAGATRTVSFKWTANAGNHNIIFIIDPYKTSADTNQADNLMQVPIVIPNAISINTLNKPNVNGLLKADPNKFLLAKGRGAWVYHDINFGGKSELITKNDSYLGDNLIGNDTISSIRVTDGCSAILFQDADFLGASEIIIGEDSWLGDNNIGNDSVSSIKIVCTAK